MKIGKNINEKEKFILKSSFSKVLVKGIFQMAKSVSFH